MDNVLSVAFCYRVFETIKTEGSTQMCIEAFCLFLLTTGFLEMKGT